MVNVLTRLRVLYEDWSEREKQGKQIKRGLGPVKKRRNRYTRRRNKTQRAKTSGRDCRVEQVEDSPEERDSCGS